MDNLNLHLEDSYNLSVVDYELKFINIVMEALENDYIVIEQFGINDPIKVLVNLPQGVCCSSIALEIVKEAIGKVIKKAGNKLKEKALKFVNFLNNYIEVIRSHLTSYQGLLKYTDSIKEFDNECASKKVKITGKAYFTKEHTAKSILDINNTIIEEFSSYFDKVTGLLIDFYADLLRAFTRDDEKLALESVKKYVEELKKESDSVLSKYNITIIYKSTPNMLVLPEKIQLPPEWDKGIKSKVWLNQFGINDITDIKGLLTDGIKALEKFKKFNSVFKKIEKFSKDANKIIHLPMENKKHAKILLECFRIFTQCYNEYFNLLQLTFKKLDNNFKLVRKACKNGFKCAKV